MGDDENRLRGTAGNAGHDVDQTPTAESRDHGRKRLFARLQDVRPELLDEPIHRGNRAGKAVGARIHEVSREVAGVRSAEGRRDLRRRQRRRADDAERGDQQRQSDEQPRPAIEPAVDRPLQRPGARPASLWAGRNRGHPGL